MAGRGNKHQKMIAAALRTLDATGHLPQSSLELGESLGFTTAEVHESFDSLEALRTGLIDHGLVLLADAIRQDIVQVDPGDPVRQIKALAGAFFHWGAENRALFRLLASALVDPIIAEGSVMELHRHSIRELVMKKLRECQAMGLLPEDADLQLIIANSHSITLGVSSMLVHGRRDAWYEGEITDLEELSRKMLDLYIDQMIPQKG